MNHLNPLVRRIYNEPCHHWLRDKCPKRLHSKTRNDSTVQSSMLRTLDGKANTKPRFVDVDEKVLLAEGEDKLRVCFKSSDNQN